MQAERIQAIVPFPQGGAPRTPGVHVSSLIRCMAVQYGILKGDVTPEDLSLVETGDNSGWWASLDPVAQLRMSIGLAWEQYYLPQISLSAYPGLIHQPGEMVCDGIYMTHDGESLDMVLSTNGVWVPSGQVVQEPTRLVRVLHEVKATYKSVNTVGDLESQWMWLMQTKAYCKALHTRFAYLHILYLCGDYSYPMRPALHVWRIEYHQREIDDAWSLIVDCLKAQRLLGRA